MSDERAEEKVNVVFQYPIKDGELENIKEPVTQSKENTFEKFKNAQRTDKWFKSTEFKLKEIIESISPLQYHDHPKVRLEISTLCEEILTYCSG